MNKKITILDDDYSDDKDKGLQDLHRKNQEELERLNMPPMPLNEKGIDADEYIDDEPVEEIIEEKNYQPDPKKKFNIYVKLMTGDVIPIEVNPNSKVLKIKEILNDEPLYDIEVNNVKKIVLFNDGDYLKDDDIIKKVLKPDDIINMFVNISDDPPFKEEKWIKLNVSSRDLKDYKKMFKKMNPAMKYNRWTTYLVPVLQEAYQRDGANYPIQIYEGNLDDFLTLPGVTTGTNLREFNRYIGSPPHFSIYQSRNLRAFRDSIINLGYSDLVYVYGVYNLYNTTFSGKSIEFIATNKDSSIVYELSGGENDVYINGFKMYLGHWLGMPRDNRLMILEYT